MSLLSIFALAAGAWTPSQSSAQAYPTAPVRLIVPYPPGGGTDALARVLSKGLAQKWNQSVTVDNRPGGDATIGIALAALAEPDGHTLAMVLTTHAVQESLKARLPYRLLQDFVPITELAEVPSVLIVSNTVDVKSVAELVALAKKNPGQLNFASTGSGGPAHLAADLFNTLAGVSTTHIPYKGPSQALPDLISGRVHFMFSTVVAAHGPIKAGKVNALAVTSGQRADSLPGLPTMSEAGVKGYEFVTWYGIVTRSGVAPAIAQKIAADIREVAHMPEVAETITREGARVVASTPEAFAQFIEKDVRRWADIVERAGLKEK